MNLYCIKRIHACAPQQIKSFGVLAKTAQHARLLAGRDAERKGKSPLPWVSIIDSRCEEVDTGISEYREPAVLWCTFEPEE